MADADHLADASVLILPDTTKFAATLKTQVEKAIREVGVQQVKVAAAASGATKKIVTDTSGSTKAATGALKENAVALKQTGSAAVRLTRQQKLLAVTERQGVVAAKAMTQARFPQAASTDAVAIATANLNAAQKALAANTKFLETAQASKSKNQIRTARAEIALAQDLVATRRAELKSAQELAALEQARAVAQDKVNAATSRSVAAETELQGVRRRIKLVDAAIVKQEALLRLERASGTAATEASAKAELDRLLALRRGHVADIQAISDRKALAASELEQARAAEAAAERQLAAAAAQRKSVASQAAAATRTQVRAQEQLRRGAFASTLSLGGVRGATLAASKSFLIGAAAIVTFAKSIALFAGFERELNTFQQVTGATADQMQRVGAEAQALGRDISLPGVSAGDAAEAMSQLARAGLSVEDAMAGARGVLQLSTAASVSVADATTLAASALNAFGLAGTDAVRVADALANAANASQGTILDMGIALQQTSAVARQVGFSLEQTTGFLTALSKAGIRGSDAGTSFRVALQRLLNPTEKIQKALDKLGVTLRDQQGNIRPELFSNLGIALAGVGKKQRDATLALIGGQDAMRTLAILSRLTTKELIALFDAQRKQGTASKLAEARTKGLAGAGQALANTLEGIGTSIGRSVAPGLTHFGHELAGALNAMAQNKQVAETLSDSLAAVGDAFQVLGIALTGIAPPALAAAGALQQVVSAIGVSEILAGAAAFVIFQRAMKAVVAFQTGRGIAQMIANIGASMRGVEVSTNAAAGAIGALKTGLRGTAAGLAAFATSATGFGIALAAIAGGLVFLLTRESQLDTAHRHLKESTDALSQSLTDLASATDESQRAQSAVQTNNLAVASARLAVQLAQVEAIQARSSGSALERAQAENRLLVAINDQKVAEQNLADAREQASQAAEVQQVRQENANARRRAEVLAINDVVEAEKRRVIAQSKQAQLTDEQKRNFVLQNQATILKGVVAEIRKRAEAARATGTVEGIENAKRLNAIANLKERLGQVSTPRAVRLILQTKDLDVALRKVAQNLGITGERGIRNFINEIKNGRNDLDAFFAGWLSDLQQFLVTGFGTIGQLSADAFRSGFGGPTGAFSIPKTGGAAFGGPGPFSLIQQQQLAEAKGDLSTALALAKQRREIFRKAIKAADTKKEQNEAIQSFLSADADVKSITNQIQQAADQRASDAKAAADEVKRKAKEAQDALDKADQALVDTLSFRRDKAALRILAAQRTKTLQDDIKAQRALKKLLFHQIEILKDSIHDQKLLQQVVLQLRSAIVQVDLDIQGLIDQQKDTQKKKKKNALDTAIASQQFQVDLAEAENRTKDEIKALVKLIAMEKKRARQLDKRSQQYRDLRLKIAQDTQTLKDLRKEQKKQNDAGKSLFFEMLQAQQGFAANVLSNIVPGLAGQGTVGGAIQAPPTVAEKKISAAAQASAGRPGATSGQSDTMIQILRAILTTLQRQNRVAGHPEARYQRNHGSGSMDVLAV